MPIFAALFLFAAAATRYHLQTTETRWQIVAWCISAAIVSLIVPRLKLQTAGPALATAAAVGAIAMKFYLERQL